MTEAAPPKTRPYHRIQERVGDVPDFHHDRRRQQAPCVDARGDQQTSLTTSFSGDDPSLRNDADGDEEACVHNLTVQSAATQKHLGVVG